MESGVHSYLDPNFHHQITYVKPNLKIDYPPPYEHEIWHYDQANVNHIRKAVDLFSWKKTLRNLNINDMIFLFLFNSSKLPSTFLKRTDKFISSISFSSNDIARIIRDLDPNKAHGHDMISIRMLKICGESISKPLGMIFKSCI